MGYDRILEKTGEFGPFQRRVYFLLCLVGFPAAIHNLGYVFWAAKPDHWCHVALPQQLGNVTREEWRRLTVPVDSKDEEERQCMRYDRNITSEDDLEQYTNATSSLVKCNTWQYDKSQYKSTIVTEYNLVCEDKWLRSMSQSVYMAGLTVSTIANGLLSDRFGRRPILLFSLALLVVTSSLAAVAPEFYSYSILRFFMAFAGTGAWQTAFVLATEVVGPSWRVFAGTVFMIFWAVGYISLAGIAYLIRNHVTLQLVTSLPFILFSVFYWLIPESPRWLLAKRKFDQAKHLITKMATVNGEELSEDIMVDLAMDIKAEVHKFLGLFWTVPQHIQLRRKCLPQLLCCWCS